jgi:hypothetical protein
MSDFFAEWNFRPEILEAMRLAIEWSAAVEIWRRRTAMVAEKIIALAQVGETDAGRLCTGALRTLFH